MNDTQLLRYSRHMLMDEIGIEGQQRLLGACALIIGAGGLGSPAALYLAAAGVGRLIVVDDDMVEMTNLQRQIIHSMQMLGQSKVQSAARAVQALNPDVRVQPLQARADAALLEQLAPQAQVVLDCSDNYATRQAVNLACVRHRVPLVAAAALRMDGQISTFDARQPLSPCYACLFSPDDAPVEAKCATMGVFGPLVGMMGCMQAAEALKIVVGFGKPLVGRVLMVNAAHMHVREMFAARNPECRVCAPPAPAC